MMDNSGGTLTTRRNRPKVTQVFKATLGTRATLEPLVRRAIPGTKAIQVSRAIREPILQSRVIRGTRVTQVFKVTRVTQVPTQQLRVIQGIRETLGNRAILV